jgi:hypothetical protein
MRYATVDFEMFSGASWFGDVERRFYEKPEDIHQYVLGRYSHWLDPEEIHDLTGTSGIFVRQSYEHGALWFAVPEHIHSFHVYDGLIFSVPQPEAGDAYESDLHLAFHILAGVSPGIRTVPETLTANVIRSAVPLLMRSSTIEGAIELAQEEIARRFSLRDELHDPWLGSI